MRKNTVEDCMDGLVFNSCLLSALVVLGTIVAMTMLTEGITAATGFQLLTVCILIPVFLKNISDWKTELRRLHEEVQKHSE